MKSKLIKVKKTDFCSLSLIDNMGKVFFWKKNIYRAISAFSFTSVNNLFNSGLISFLEKKNLIPSSKFLNNKVVGYKAVIQHETAKVVSYPHEWSFEMLKKAAETILEVNKTAIKFGFQTNDCHSYNIVFFNGKPKFVDIGSFFRIPPIFKNYLFSYAEFCKCYLFPMLIWSVGDTHTARLYLQRWKNMTPPDAYIAYRLGGCKGLIRRFALKFWLLRERIQGVPHILSKKASRKYSNRTILLAKICNKIKFPLKRSTILSLEQKIKKIKALRLASDWGDYHWKVYGRAGSLVLSKRFKQIIKIIREIGVSSVTDIGGNQGLLSEAIAAKTSVNRVICLDTDESAIDAGYTRTCDNKILAQKLIFAVVNPFYPTINELEQHPKDRFKSDLAIACAITHHLVLTQGFSLDYIFSVIKEYSRKFVMIEFMPLGHYSVFDGITEKPPKWYTQSWFLKNFRNHFNLIYYRKLEKNRIIFFGKIT